MSKSNLQEIYQQEDDPESQTHKELNALYAEDTEFDNPTKEVKYNPEKY